MLYLPSHTTDLCGEQSKTEVVVQLTFILQLCAHAHSDFVHIKDGTWQRHCVRHGRKSWGLESHESEKIMAEYSFLRALNNYFDCQWIKQLLLKSAQHQITPSTKMLQCKYIINVFNTTIQKKNLVFISTFNVYLTSFYVKHFVWNVLYK